MSSQGVSSYGLGKSAYSRYNVSESISDIRVFVGEFRERLMHCLKREEDHGKTPFHSFAERKFSVAEISWLQDNTERFLKDTENQSLVEKHYLAECGFICCMMYSPDGETIILGHSSGLIQVGHAKMPDPERKEVIQEYAKNIKEYFRNELHPKIWYPMFYREKSKEKYPWKEWVEENNNKYLKNTPNKILQHRWYCSEKGAITSMQFAPNGFHIIVGHTSGCIEMRHGSTGTVLCTLRNIQFPPKPVHALAYSPIEPNICYAACMDGAVYRIEIPHIDTSVTDPPGFCIRADPMLDSLNIQFYGSPGISSCATPFITQRYAALSLGLMSDGKTMAVGYGDTSIKVYDMETQEALITYKVHKLRLQFIPKKLQRMHFGQVVALRTHPQNPVLFASGAWDKTLRIWDVRCHVGCVMTFEGVDICSDAIDLNREQCIAGSWSPTSGLSVWDLTARKLQSFIRVQNRRQDVDGEYVYACRYWRSTDYNRKGKYAIIGGSGTSCLEVINLHNRYITCSYPTTGAILAVTSHQERIAFGGTSSAFNIVSFYDPKYQKDKYNLGKTDSDYSRPVLGVITLYHDDESMFSSSVDRGDTETPGTPSSIEPNTPKPGDIRPDTVKQDIVKLDTPKQSDVKQDAPKQAAAKQAAAKQVVVKQADAKQETPKQSDIKQDAPKKGDVKLDTPKQSDVKQDTLKQADAKQDTPKQGDVKQDTPKQSAVKQDIPEKGDVKPDTPKQADAELETPKQGEVNQDTPEKSDVKPDTPKQADAELETPKQGEVNQDTPEKVDVKPDTPKQADAKLETTKQGEVKQDTPKQGDVNPDTPKQVDAELDTPTQGDVKE